MQSAFSSRPHRESKWESDAQMTGGITADDIGKFDDMVSCGLAAGLRTVDSGGARSSSGMIVAA